MSRHAFLLAGFGGPSGPEEIRPFLDNVLRGRPVPPARYEEVVRQYLEIGGASPFNPLTFELAEGLFAFLKSRGEESRVYVGMRHAPPFLPEVIERMAREGAREATCLILSSFVSEAGWLKYVAAVKEACAAIGPAAPRVRFAAPWFKDPLFAEAVAARVKETLSELPAERRARAAWIFTAHSLPVSMDRTSSYSKQLRWVAAAVAARFFQADWTLAYQSRSGRPEDPWLEPDVGDALKAAAERGAADALVIPLGFLIDHVEVLFDLDRKARRVAEASGLGFHRAKTVGAHPLFLELLSRRAMGAASFMRTSRAAAGAGI